MKISEPTPAVTQPKPPISNLLNPGAVLTILKETGSEWSDDKVPRLSAALAYYTIFSLAPVLIIAVAIAGLVFGQDAAQGEIVRQISGLVGKDNAETIQSLLRNAYQPGSGRIATIIGITTLMLGASGVFAELQDALNTIWGVAPKPGRSPFDVVKERVVSFSMVLVIAFLLLASLVVSAVLSALSGVLNVLPGPISGLVDNAVSLSIITLLFAMLFKILPDVKIAWRDVWIGAGITAFLFIIGKSLIGLYLGTSSFSSTYGAAGSLVVLLVWIFYSVQILFLGAEFTKVFARRYGSDVVPASNAIFIRDLAASVPEQPQKAVVVQERVDASKSEKSEPEKTNPLKRIVASLIGLVVVARKS